ncbi:hypothetical protein HMPREF1141_2378 [Clostridium sp. MSTE9]|uniref:hypothetical protein n=1 Tax=Clostridium sp. (strain MSTE9) TaxID=1105031 RepID=UPI00026F1B41|nr:hypothetical protein [Clostridium sp. MSTE9]EJF38484.1 hypothetical protein HMPREF1141_2378 [Clostridium sp. MSTE9]
MKTSDIQQEILDLGKTTQAELALLPEEIPGALPCLHILQQGSSKTLEATGDTLRVLFLIQGKLEFSSRERQTVYSEKAVYAEHPQKAVTITALEDAHVLEIRWKLTEKEVQEMESAALPFTQTYEQAQKYRDPFKSEKTISRAIVPHRVLPRFAMGSVETHGTDLIGQHAHPLLDQFFYSFSENDCILLIDSLQHPMKSDTILHIPLGSNHGVFVGETQCAHYLWIDFIPDESGLTYLDEVHKPV